MVLYLSYLIACALPSYLIKIPLPAVIGGSVNLLDVLLLLFIFSFILFLIRKKLISSFLKFAVSSKAPILPAFLILIAVIVGYFANMPQNNWQDGLGLIKSFYILPITTSLSLSFLVRQKIVSAGKLAGAYATSSTFVAIIGIAAAFFGRLTYDGRLELFFGSPNYLGMYLAPGIIICWYFWKHPHHLPRRLADAASYTLPACTLIQAIALVLTQSTGSILGLLLLFGCFFLLEQKLPFLAAKKIFMVTVVFSIFFNLLAFSLNGFALKKLEAYGYSPFLNRSSLDSRLVIYAAGTKIIQDHWLSGIGPGNFQITYLGYQKFYPPYPQWAVPHPHNMLLHAWLEAGLFGYLVFIWLLFSIGRKIPSGKEGRRNPAFLILFYLILHGIVDTPLSNNAIAMLFWAVIFLIPVLHYEHDNE